MFCFLLFHVACGRKKKCAIVLDMLHFSSDVVHMIPDKRRFPTTLTFGAVADISFSYALLALAMHNSWTRISIVWDCSAAELAAMTSFLATVRRIFGQHAKTLLVLASCYFQENCNVTRQMEAAQGHGRGRSWKISRTGKSRLAKNFHDNTRRLPVQGKKRRSLCKVFCCGAHEGIQRFNDQMSSKRQNPYFFDKNVPKVENMADFS